MNHIVYVRVCVANSECERMASDTSLFAPAAPGCCWLDQFVVSAKFDCFLRQLERVFNMHHAGE